MVTRKVIPIKAITSWSFSRYSDYKLCPLKARFKHVEKMKEPQNAAMARGEMIHKLAEDYIKGKLKKLPPELALFKEEFADLRARYKKRAQSMVVEDNWAFDKGWGESAWNDWVNCVVRIKLDCAFHEADDVMRIRDWKTGKFRAQNNEEYVEQLELYALAALILHPHIETVLPELCYLDEGIIYPEPGSEDAKRLTFTQADVPALKKRWAKRTKAMLSDTSFAPRPNNLCSWCWFGQSKKKEGGPGLCVY